ncbi:MAG: hypothetical protein IKX53_04425 [Bacteroidales bacterium]|nr:hypothetical protein [Bacteroidales bacterium]
MKEQLTSLFIPAIIAVFLATACNTLAPEKNQLSDTQQPVVSEKTMIPYCLKVNTDMTKVSYAEGNYQFKAGDILHVVGVERTDIEGDLTKDASGTTWSGTLSYSTSAGAPNADTQLKVTLIHADNNNAESYATALVGALPENSPEGMTLLQYAVEHYSLFTNQVTFGTASATLLQQAAFLDVTIEFDFDGTHSVDPGNALVDLKINQIEKTADAPFVEKPNTNGEDFLVHFVAVVPGGISANDFNLAVGDRKIDFADNLTLARNKKYTVNRTVSYHPQLGDPFWSDGLYGRLRHPDQSTSIVGIIVYVNQNNSEIGNALTEKTVENGNTRFGHGLVMSLKNADVYVPWSGSTTTACTQSFITKPNQTTAVSNLSGYTNTLSIISTLGQGTNSAASIAKNYNVSVSTEYSTGWFLPSIGQWMYAISQEGFGGANPSSEWINGNHKLWLGNEGSLNDLIYVMENGNSSSENLLVQYLNNRLEQLKTEFNVDYDAFGMWKGKKFADNYWSSSEGSAETAIRMNFGSVEQYDNKYWATIKVKPEPKGATSAWESTFILKVRPFLAF